MHTVLKSLVLFLAILKVAAAQSAYLYNNIASDGTYVTITGVIQSSSWPGSYGAIHTYSQNLRVASPSRSSSCSFNDPVPASQYYSQQCEAQLSIFDGSGLIEQGPYTVTGNQQADCNQVGTFAYTPIFDSLPLMHIKAYYYYTNVANQGKSVYKRCSPIGTTCDYCSIVIGPPTWNYGLFDGIEIHIRGNAICTMEAVQQVNSCLVPDPTPGTGGGVAKVQPNLNDTPPNDHSIRQSKERTIAKLREPVRSNTSLQKSH